MKSMSSQKIKYCGLLNVFSSDIDLQCDDTAVSLSPRWWQSRKRCRVKICDCSAKKLPPCLTSDSAVRHLMPQCVHLGSPRIYMKFYEHISDSQKINVWFQLLQRAMLPPYWSIPVCWRNCKWTPLLRHALIVCGTTNEGITAANLLPAGWVKLYSDL